MEKIRISKVDDVTLWRHGVRVEGTLHLTSHHIIFCYQQPPPPNHDTPSKPKSRELWITYPMLSYCTYRPAPPASRQAPSIRLKCRDFTFVAFHFVSESKARDVYDSIKSLTCRLGRIEKLYAFSYRPQSPEKEVNGWEVYDPRREWKRQGISSKDMDKGWRISEINANYQYSPTYPAVLPVPSVISDNVLKYAGTFRSRVRIPVLSYLHPVNNCSITRSSQPLVGIRGSRSVQDERLVAAIFNTSKPQSASLQVDSGTTSPSRTPTPSQSSVNLSSTSGESSFVDAVDSELLEDVAIAEATSEVEPKETKIYGATQSNIIIDARPPINAYAMQTVGKGSENMDNYPFATKAYLNIANIHVMRDSLNKVVDALKDTDVTPLPPNREQLTKSGWLGHISGLLKGSSMIARQVGLYHSHVLIHCSDGWDRTSQLSALSQICLDPYYRTLEGFIVLVEKDWLSFGHMFRQRCGFLGSDKWFEIENERIGASRRDVNGGPGSAGGPGNAFENALHSARGLFKKKNDSRESLVDSEGEMQPFDSSPAAKRSSQGRPSLSDDKIITKVKETSPVFHQFLDCTQQMLHQHPTRFEFNERFLRRLLYHLYSCQFGTFLYDNEKQRVEAHAAHKTRSVWDYFLSRREQFTNPSYDPTIDDNIRGKERLLFPRGNDEEGYEVRWWAEAFGRTDAEMNGPTVGAGVRSKSPLNPVERQQRAEAHAPVLTGLENAKTQVGDVPAAVAAHQSTSSENGSLTDQGGAFASTDEPVAAQSGSLAAQGADRLTAGLASLGIGRASTSSSRPHSPGARGTEMVEVEMQ